MRLLTGFVAVAGLLASSAVFADTIETLNFTYTDPNAGNLMAAGTLLFDATTGLALSGNGTLNSTLFVASDGVTPLGTQSMFLMTPSGPKINTPPGTAAPAFQWQDSDGTNILADNVLSLSFPYVDINGISFAVGAPNSTGNYASFNIYYQGGQWLADFEGHGGPPGMGQVYYTGMQGALSMSPVPVPPAVWLLLSGLAGLALLRYRLRDPMPGRLVI